MYVEIVVRRDGGCRGISLVLSLKMKVQGAEQPPFVLPSCCRHLERGFCMGWLSVPENQQLAVQVYPIIHK